jgi:hypothetical protein
MYSDLHHQERLLCFRCECPKNILRDDVPSEKQHPQRGYDLYRTLSDANTNPVNAELLSRHVHRGFTVFPHLPHIVRDHPKPDLLHSMQIDMPDHLEKWTFNFMKMHEWLDKDNAIWLSVPAYHNLTPNNESYERDAQWNGKEMKEMSRYLL